jgi:uncharacterized protein
MPNEVLFVQGGGAGAYAADAKLAESLQTKLGSNYRVRYPAMPNEEEADYRTWKRVIVEEARRMGDDAILCGHSIGASVLIKVLTERGPKPSLAGAFLVAGPFWHEHKVWRWEEAALSDDAGEHYPPGAALFFYHGGDDEVVPVAHLDMYAKAFPKAIFQRLPGRNHQINDDMGEVARDIQSLV